MTTINHISVGSLDPKKAASNLAELVEGSVDVFPPYPGAYVCFFSSKRWTGSFIEFYPKGLSLKPLSSESLGESVGFCEIKTQDVPNSTHVNLSVSFSLREISVIASKLGLAHSLRHGRALLDVWLESDLLVEFATLKTSE